MEIPLKEADQSWKSNGILLKFDQQEIIDVISEDYKNALGKDDVTLDTNYHNLQ